MLGLLKGFCSGLGNLESDSWSACCASSGVKSSWGCSSCWVVSSGVCSSGACSALSPVVGCGGGVGVLVLGFGFATGIGTGAGTAIALPSILRGNSRSSNSNNRCIFPIFPDPRLNPLNVTIAWAAYHRDKC